MNKLTKVYGYDPITKEYTGELLAQYNPKKPDELLMPQNATEVRPPFISETHIALIFKDNKWQKVPDYRGTWYSIKTKEKLEITEINKKVPTGYVSEAPSSEYDVWTDIGWEESEEHKIETKKTQITNIIKKYMNESQDRVDRYRNQKEIELVTTDSESTFKSLLKYMQYLRDYNKAESWYNNEPKTFEEWL